MLDSIAHPPSKYEAWKQLFPNAESSLDAFVNNNTIITEHNIKYNAGNSTYELGHNQFSGLSSAAFSKKYLGLNYPSSPPPRKANIHIAMFNGGDTPPPSYDWSTKGAVAPDKNQESCGSCWSFAAASALEGAYQIKNNKFISFSEQQLVSCSPPTCRTAAGACSNDGCDGGIPDNAFRWIQKNGGLCSGADYLYTSGAGDSGTCITGCKNVEGSNITAITDVDRNEAALKSAAYQQPVAVAIDAASTHFQSYKSGIFTGAAASGSGSSAVPECGTILDHAVLVVGYGTDGGADYWKVRNSWGATWGENGYVRMSRAETPAKSNGADCGILKAASYPTVS